MTFARASVLPVLAALLAPLLVCASAMLQACAADPGDGPKGDAGSSASGDDGAPQAEAEPSDSSELDSGQADTTLPSTDSSTGMDSSFPPESSVADVGVQDSPGVVDVVTCTTCPLVVQYLTNNTATMNNTMSPQFEIFNNGASPVDMTVLTMRYYYTAQGSTSQEFACDYFAAAGGCGTVQATFVAMSTPTATADHYIQIAFTSGSIPSGMSTGGLQTRLHDTNYAVTFDQTLDYSFNASDTAFTPWNHITLYQSGSLVYGVEP